MTRTISYSLLATLVLFSCAKKKSTDEAPKGDPAMQAPKAASPMTAAMGTVGNSTAKPSVKPFSVVKPRGLVKGSLRLQTTIPATAGPFKGVQAHSGRLFGQRARKPFGSAVLEMSDGRSLATFTGVPRPVAFSSDGEKVAVILGGSVEIYRFATMQKLGTLAVLTDKKAAKDAPPMGTTLFVSVAFSSDGKYLATGEINFGKFDSNHKQTVSIWNAHSLKRLATQREEETDANVCDVRFLPGDKAVFMSIVGGPGKTGSFSRRLEFEGGNAVMPGLTLKPGPEVPFNVPCDECIDSWSLLGPLYAVSYSMKLDGSVNLYRLADGTGAAVLPFTKKAEEDSVRRFERSADGTLLAFGVCAEKKGPVDDFGNPTLDQIPYRYILVDAKTFKEKKGVAAAALAFHPVSAHMAYVAGDELRIATIAVPEKVLGSMKFDGAPMALAFSIDGTRLILATDKGTFVYAVQ